jgi:hypothetical protein
MRCINPVCPIKYDPEKEPCLNCQYNVMDIEDNDVFQYLKSVLYDQNK